MGGFVAENMVEIITSKTYSKSRKLFSLWLQHPSLKYMQHWFRNCAASPVVTVTAVSYTSSGGRLLGH